MLGEFCFVLSQQKFEATDGTALQPSDGPVSQLLDWPVLQLHFTVQFYLKSKGKYILEAWGNFDPKDRREERPPIPILAPLFMFSHLPLGLPCVNWVIQECCLFYLRSSLWSWDLPLFYFCGLFPSLSFSHCHSGLLFPILTTQQQW